MRKGATRKNHKKLLRGIELEDRRTQVARLYTQGYSQWEIARQFGVSQAIISIDISTIREQWQKATLRDTEVKVKEELAKIELTEREAWAAWEFSRWRVIKGRKVELPGDSKWLDVLVKCRTERAKLLGLYHDVNIKNTQVNIGVNPNPPPALDWSSLYGEGPRLSDTVEAEIKALEASPGPITGTVASDVPANDKGN